MQVEVQFYKSNMSESKKHIQYFFLHPQSSGPGSMRASSSKARTATCECLKVSLDQVFFPNVQRDLSGIFGGMKGLVIQLNIYIYMYKELMPFHLHIYIYTASCHEKCDCASFRLLALPLLLSEVTAVQTRAGFPTAGGPKMQQCSFGFTQQVLGMSSPYLVHTKHYHIQQEP